MSVNVNQIGELSGVSDPYTSYVAPLGKDHDIETATEDNVEATDEFSRKTGEQAQVTISPSIQATDQRHELWDKPADDRIHGSTEWGHTCNSDPWTCDADGAHPGRYRSQATYKAGVNSRKKIILLCLFHIFGLGTALGHW